MKFMIARCLDVNRRYPGCETASVHDEQTSTSNPTDNTSVTSPTPSSLQVTVTASGDMSSPSSSALSTSVPHKSTKHTGAIAGGVVGGVVGLALIAFLAFFLLRRRRQRQATRGAPSSEFMHHPAVRARSATPLIAGRLRPQRLDSEQEALRISHSSTFDVRISEDELPPPFTTGSFRDPVLEKAETSARYLNEMHAREAEMQARARG